MSAVKRPELIILLKVGLGAHWFSIKPEPVTQKYNKCDIGSSTIPLITTLYGKNINVS
jgi:hypothetical protein